MTTKIVLSEEIKEMRPYWKQFIIDLGYTQEQADNFAAGYEEELNKLSTIDKLYALERQHQGCMTAGFKKAGINEDEAWEKAQ